MLWADVVKGGSKLSVVAVVVVSEMGSKWSQSLLLSVLGD